MELSELFAIAFEQGCGVDFEELLDGQELAERVEAAKCFYAALIPGSDLDIAARSGHIQFGGGLNFMAESQVLSSGFSGRLPTDEDLEQQVLLQILGENLINAAGEHLSHSLIELAKHWGDDGMSAEDQLVFAQTACREFQALFEKQEPADEDLGEWWKGLSEDAQMAITWLEESSATHDADTVLPAKYHSGTRPNCLGMSILLAAFARETGSRFMWCTVVHHTMDQRWIAEPKVVGYLAGLIDRRPLPELEQYKDRLVKTLESSRAYASRPWDYHHAIVVELADERWVLLDPYQSNCGLLDYSWEAGQTYQLIERYSVVLPGLTLLGCGRQAWTQWEQTQIDRLAEADRHSRSLEELFYYEIPVDPASLESGEYQQRWWQSWVQGWWHDAYTFVGYLEDAAETDFLVDQISIRREDAEKAVKLLLLLFPPEEMGGLDRLKDWDSYFEATLTYWHLFNDDSEYREELRQRLFSSFLLTAVDVFQERSDKLSKLEGGLPHPVMEFSRPEPNIALAVLNHLRCWTDNSVSGIVLLPYSSSQMYWHQAAQLTDDGYAPDADCGLLRQAEAMVRQMPFHHPSVARKLEFLDGIGGGVHEQIC